MIAIILASFLCPPMLWAASAKAEPVTIERSDCMRMTRYQPPADVAYQPGVDVYGRPVAAADLDNGTRIDLPTSFSFDLEFAPLEEEDRLDLSTFVLGVVEIDEDGRAYFNGQLLDDSDEATLARLCAEALDASEP